MTTLAMTVEAWTANWLNEPIGSVVTSNGSADHALAKPRRHPRMARHSLIPSPQTATPVNTGVSGRLRRSRKPVRAFSPPGVQTPPRRFDLIGLPGEIRAEHLRAGSASSTRAGPDRPVAPRTQPDLPRAGHGAPWRRWRTAAAVRSPLNMAPWIEAVSRWSPHTNIPSPRSTRRRGFRGGG